MELKNITKIYHNKNNVVRALNNITLRIPNIGVTCILGPSGCGKTTLLNIISSQDKDYEGVVKGNGRVEAITQDILLFENLSILDNLLLVSDNLEQINQLLEKFQLKDAKKKVKKLSVGEKKRVQIVRSLLSNATYLICDEPTAALDHDNSELVMSLLKDISKEIGVIIVTHRIAIVEKYADYMIKMDKGCILESPEIVDVEEIDKKENEKKTIKNYLHHLYKTMKSRWQEHVFHFGLIFFLVIIAFIMTSVFPSLNDTSKATSNWLNGKNVILTNPVHENEDGVVLPNEDSYVQYDLYKKEDVELVKSNIDGIIGYRIGWDIYKYAVAEDGAVDGTSYMPYISIKDYVEKLEPLYPEYVSTGKDPIPFFSSDYQGIKRAESTNGDARVLDFSNFYGQKFICDPMFEAARNMPHVDAVCIADIYNEIIPYQLFENVEFNLIDGSFPSKENEILLSKNVAEEMVAYYGLNNLQELVGKEVSIFLKKGAHTTLYEEYELGEYSFIISGITYMQSQYEKQVFFVENGYENCMVDFFEYTPDVATYQYIYFLIDPLEDGSKIADRINQLLDVKDSRFMVYNDFNNIETESYQEPGTMFGYVSFGLLTILVLYIIMQVLLNKRIMKENNILRRYGYPAFMLQLTKMMIILGVIGMLQLSSLSYVCELLNSMANALGVADIVSYSIPNYLLSLFLTVLFIALLEGCLYVIRTKKYS